MKSASRSDVQIGTQFIISPSKNSKDEFFYLDFYLNNL